MILITYNTKTSLLESLNIITFESTERLNSMTITVFSKKTKRTFLATCTIAGLVFFSSPCLAQTSMEELRAHPEYTASNYLVYPEPDRNVKYTKAPKGYSLSISAITVAMEAATITAPTNTTTCSKPSRRRMPQRP